MSSTVVSSKPWSANSENATRSMSSRVVAGGRPAPLCAPDGICTPALWTLLAPCANIFGMTAAAPETVVPRTGTGTASTDEVAEEDLVLADLLVEEISIDGMCGVY